MKRLLALALAASLAGCVVTGGVEYTDPKTGATARIGFGTSGKEMKPPGGYSK